MDKTTEATLVDFSPWGLRGTKGKWRGELRSPTWTSGLQGTKWGVSIDEVEKRAEATYVDPSEKRGTSFEKTLTATVFSREPMHKKTGTLRERTCETLKGLK